MTDLRSLPHVDQVLREVPELASTGSVVARWLVRRAVDAARDRIKEGDEPGDIKAAVAAAARALTDRRILRVINATGVILHTNLGRAPLDPAAIAGVLEAAGAAALEFDPATGRRGARAPVAATLAAALTEAEDALIVNNNAAALLLVLGALARGREVLVSRGELIEIGGAFRLPELLGASGAILREVGTTNRTHLRDYRDAVRDGTGLILKIHPSNYRVVGFTATPSAGDLSEVARTAGVPLLYDIGSGLLRPEDEPLEHEPDAATALAAGCDLVCFSGDKLLGGPQAGIIVGTAALVDRCRRHPLARAVRADKLSLAALEQTLWAHARGETGAIPVRTMLLAPVGRITDRARRLAAAVPNGAAEVVAGETVIGGGSLPGRALPTALVVVRAGRAEALAAALRAHRPPVIARVEHDVVVLDLRTVAEAEDQVVLEALLAALAL